MNILVIVTYHNRPDMLRECLGSITHSDPIPGGQWRLALHDDASDVPGEPIAREITDGDNAVFTRCEDSPHRKCQLGMRINDILRRSKEDVAVLLCDDDMLTPGYLAGLAGVFNANPGWAYCYSQNAIIGEDGSKADYGSWGGSWDGTAIDPSHRCDISQVAWRIRCNNEDGVWFPAWAEKNHDTEFFRRMHAKYGSCPFSGLVGQYKRIHSGQLGASDDTADVVAAAKSSAVALVATGNFDLAERIMLQASLVAPDDRECLNLLASIRRLTTSTNCTPVATCTPQEGVL